jgi:hypothetical protein
MAIDNLYISHQFYKWSPSTKLLTANNFEKIIASTVEYNCHTSVEDINYSNIEILLHKVKKIHLIDINLDVLDQYPNSFASYGRMFRCLDKNKHKIVTGTIDFISKINFNKTTIRHVDDPVLWTAGGSITVGLGVSKDQRYSNLLAEKMQMEEICLAQAGNSIALSCDSILRSDIKPGDIVVWDITNLGRVEDFNNFSLDPVVIAAYAKQPKERQYWTLDYFSSATHGLKNIHHLFQAINFCKKIGAKLYIANTTENSWIPIVLKDYKNFIDFTDNESHSHNKLRWMPNWIDLATDGLHPGPLQHRYYAEEIFKIIIQG